ncbi:hypothetical protein BGX38DRAFT_298668 [Terfezia claveryi]|nr:hypothetical protein BGX38DRAFT_298668 [Terfezia claveryi]
MRGEGRTIYLPSVGLQRCRRSLLMQNRVRARLDAFPVLLCLCTLPTYKHFSSLPRALGQVFTCPRGLQERPGVRQGLVQACSRTTSPAPWHFHCCWVVIMSRPCPVRGVHCVFAPSAAPAVKSVQVRSIINIRIQRRQGTRSVVATRSSLTLV